MITVRASRRGSATIITDLAGTEPWRPRVLPADRGLARVALVGSRASLLGGDDVAIDIVLDAGCALEVVELAATVAHHARGGPPARSAARVSLGPGACLVWLAEPLIAAAGCDVLRSTRVELAAGAVVLLGETLVLGRFGESPGAVRAHTRITVDGRPVLDETLNTTPAWLLRSSVVGGGAAVIDAVTLAGLRDPDPPPGAVQTHEPATLWRQLRAGGSADGDVRRRWRRLLIDRRV